MVKPITRFDFEVRGEYIRFSAWEAGWKPGDKPKITYSKSGSLQLEKESLEKLGFTIEMFDETHGRALRGKIAR